MTDNKRFWKIERNIFRGLILLCTLVLIIAVGAAYFISNPSRVPSGEDAGEYSQVPGEDINKIENGIHVRTGLKDGKGLMETVNNCTGCHSAKLIIQNKMDREAWVANIRWMQATQNLWDLGENEEIILDYLVTNYPPDNKGRRENLKEVQWYALEK